MLDCNIYQAEKDIMIETIERIYIEHDVPPYDRKIDITTLLGGNKEHSNIVTSSITTAVCSFIEATRRSL